MEAEKKTFRQKVKTFLTWDVSDVKDINEKIEIKANRMASITMFNLAILIGITLILNIFGVFSLGRRVPYLGILSLEFIVPAIICFFAKGRGRWIKFVLIIGMVLGVTLAYIVQDTSALLTMILPLVVSCRYYSYKFVGFTAGLTIVMLALGTVLGVLYGNIDLNVYTYAATRDLLNDDGTFKEGFWGEMFNELLWGKLIGEQMRFTFLPNCLICIILAVTCIFSAIRGRDIANEEVRIASRSSRIESELNLASSIQTNMLPRIFPPFPTHDEFDVYATMAPAKEVGGDFYDFFMIDDTHIAYVVADVSGKGVPAALFMVTAKTLIKDHAQLGLTPAEVFTRVNKILCEGNEAGLFITAWMGVVDLRSGVLTYVNAGHTVPLLMHDGGNYEFLKSPAGFVLSGLDSIKYKQYETTLKPGDRIFLYTDGVTEATNAEKKLYGEKRLQTYLNEHKRDTLDNVLHGLRTDIDEFVDGEDQFDDITMLIFSLKRIVDEVEKTFAATDEALADANAFLEEEMEKGQVPVKESMQLSVALEEIFVNVAHYAYPGRTGNVHISITVKNRAVKISFKDSGFPFNPLLRADPDVTLSASERNIGGLGIYMVKKSMDELHYKYMDGMNVLTIVKKF